jgi:prolyl oligopeptidase
MLGALGCGGNGREGRTTPNAEQGNEARLIAELNQRAREGAVTETIHGTEVEDPYRSLEEDTPETQAWIEAQTTRTERRLAPFVTAEMTARISSLMSIGLLTNSDLGGDRVFFMERSADQEQSVLKTRSASDDGPARVLLDPATIGERVSIDWYFPSPSGRLVALGLSHNGDERSVLRLIDVGSGQELADQIPNCKWTTVAWLRDESGFYYTRYPREGEPDYDADEPDAYFPRIFFHRLGDASETDRLIYGAEEPQDFPSPSVSDDDRYLVINVMRGWSASDVYLLDRQVRDATPQPVSQGCDCLISGAMHHGRLWLSTNEDHPRYRVMAADLANAGDREQWREVIPESEATIVQFGVTADRLVVHEMRDFASRVRLTTHGGEPAGELELPANGSVDGLVLQDDSNRLALVFSSFFYPPTLLVADAVSREVRELAQVETDVAVDRYQVTQTSVASADGTQVNVFLVHRRGARPDGSHRVLLYGYGGFNISILPAFSRRALYWLEQGGVYAVANLRGGGELGEAWHQAGQLENKHHVFEDFEAVVRWLGGSWSSPQRIAILGGSNGGLLVGVTLNRCPEAFAAAVSYVGLYDMVRYHRFPPAELWVSEYGSAEDAHQFGYLHEYSPYHNLRPGTTYPATLIETADHDSRVFWGHSTKFAARLQESAADPTTIHFYMDRSVGHGAGTGRSDLIEQTIRLYAFLAWQMGQAASNGAEGENDDRED